MKYADPVARLIANSVLAANDCWTWIGRYNNVGRPVISVRLAPGRNPTKITIARYVVQFVHGKTWCSPARRGKVVGAHSCHNEKCANPDHIRRSSQRKNIQENIARGVHHVFPSKASDLHQFEANQ